MIMSKRDMVAYMARWSVQLGRDGLRDDWQEDVYSGFFWKQGSCISSRVGKR